MISLLSLPMDEIISNIFNVTVAMSYYLLEDLEILLFILTSTLWHMSLTMDEIIYNINTLFDMRIYEKS